MARLLRGTPPQPQYSPLPPVRPPVVTTLSVNFASGLLTRQRRAQQRGVMGWDGGGQADGRLNFSNTDGASPAEVGTTTFQRAAMRFTPAANGFLTDLVVQLGFFVGTPTDSVTVSITSNTAGNVPDNNYIATVTVPASALSGTLREVTAKFAGVPITGGTLYWIVLGRDGPPDNANTYQFEIASSGTTAVWNGTTWDTGLGAAIYSRLYTANSVTQIALPMTQRLVGPRPPLLVKAPPTDRQTTLSVNLASGLLTQQRRAQQRFPRQGWEQDESSVGPTYTGVAIAPNDSEPNAPAVALTNPLRLVAQSFTTLAALSSVTAKLVVSQTGTPVDTLVCSVYTDNAGEPGTNLGSGVVTGITASFALCPATIPAALAPNTKYWLVWGRSGVLDNVNFYRPGQSSLTQTASLTLTGGPPWSIGQASILSRLEGTTGPTVLLQRRFIGPRPPQVINPLPSDRQQTVQVYPASGLLTNQRRAQQRRTTSKLRPPTVVTAAATFVAAPIVVVPASGLLTNQRRAQQRRTTSKLSPPTTLQTFAGPQVYCLHIDRIGRRYRRYTMWILEPPTVVSTSFVASPIVVVPASGLFTNQRREQQRRTTSKLAPPTVVATGFVAPPLAVYCLHIDRIGRRYRRFPMSLLAPPTTLNVFAGPTTKLVKARPRPTEHVLAPPTVVRVPSVEQREQTVTVALTHTRPRPTTKRLAPPATLQIFFGPDVTVSRTRPESTHSVVRPPTVVAAAAATYPGPVTKLVRTRPRLTVWSTSRLLLVQPAAPVETVVQVTLVRSRPRPTAHVLEQPTTLRVFQGPAVHTTVRPRPAVHSRLPLVVVAVVAQAYYGPTVELAQTRRRVPAVSELRPPTVLQVFAGPDTTLVRSRPRPTVHSLTAVSYPATSEIQVTLVRTRPRPTTHALTAVRYAASSEISVTLVQTRPRPTTTTLGQPTDLQVFAGPSVHLTPARRPKPTSRLEPPATLEPYSVELQEQTVKVVLAAKGAQRRRTTRFLTDISYEATSEISVTLVRTRPRPTGRTLGEPAVLQTFAGPLVFVTKTRPRPTTTALEPPTVVRVPSVEQRQQTISITLVRTRPRQTRPLLRTVIVPSNRPVVTTLTVVTVALKRRRDQIRRSVEYFLRPPTRVIPLPTLRVQTITVKVVRTRPRPTTRRLYRPTVLSVFQAAVLPPVRTRPRPTQALLRPPTVIRVPEVEQRLRTISVALAPSRYPTTRSRLRPPAVVRAQFIAAPVTVELVHTRPRPLHTFLEPPTVLETYSGPSTHLAPARRPETRSLLLPLPPTRPERVTLETDLRVNLVARRLDAQTRSRLAPPTALQPERTVLETDLRVNLVARRLEAQPHSRLQPPTVLAPAVTRIRVALARAVRQRSTTAQLFGYVVAARAAVEKNIATSFARTRPKPTTAALFPPTRLRPPETTVRTHLVRRTTRPGAASLLPPTVVRDQFIAAPITVELAPARRPVPQSTLTPPPVLQATPVVTEITVVLVALEQRTLHRPVRHFALVPAVVRIRKGGRSEGSTVPASASEGGSSGSTASEGGTQPSGAASGEASAQHRVTIRDVPSARSEGEDRS